MEAYADFDYYEDTYLGTSIASDDFPRLALRATAVIDQITFNRAAGETDTDTVDKIKMAMCAVAEQLQTIEANGGDDGIVSESIGSNSVTYAANAAKRQTNQTKLTQAANLYLSSTGLLFRGFASGEYANEC